MLHDIALYKFNIHIHTKPVVIMLLMCVCDGIRRRLEAMLSVV